MSSPGIRGDVIGDLVLEVLFESGFQRHFCNLQCKISSQKYIIGRRMHAAFGTLTIFIPRSSLDGGLEDTTTYIFDMQVFCSKLHKSIQKTSTLIQQ